MVEVMKIMPGVSYDKAEARVIMLLDKAAADPNLCQRLFDAHRQVWVSLLWSYCSILLGPGAHKILFVPSKS